MKNSLLLCFLLVYNLVFAFSKDIQVKIKNQNDLSIELFAGVITPEQNKNSDEEILAKKNALGISNLGTTILGLKEATFIKTGVSRDRYIVIYGQFNGGGRTEIKRYNTNDVWSTSTIEILFPLISTQKPTNSFVNIVAGLKAINNAGAYVALDNLELLGTFVLTKPKTESSEGFVFPLIPKVKMIPENFNEISTQVEDIVTSEANSSINIEFPLASSVKGIFGTSKIMSLVWVVVNSRPVIYKPENGDYYELYQSCSEKSKRIALEMFTKDPVNTKLLLIRNAHLTDEVRLESFSLSRIDNSTELKAHDIVDITGNYKRSSSSSFKSKEVKIIKEVYAMDMSIILQSELAQRKQDQEVAQLKAIIDQMKKEIPEIQISATDGKKIKEDLSSPETIQKINEGVGASTNKLPVDIKLVEEIKKKIEGQN